MDTWAIAILAFIQEPDQEMPPSPILYPLPSYIPYFQPGTVNAPDLASAMAEAERLCSEAYPKTDGWIRHAWSAALFGMPIEKEVVEAGEWPEEIRGD